MATYIQGVTDYIPQIQPFQPDFNFFNNVMSVRQGRYDANKKKVNDLYGTLLYSPMLKDENIQRRENYFKVINEDIKKVSGMDLSLQQNVDQALNVFRGFYEDEYMVNDMVKTKKVMQQIERGKSFKGCVDPKKCGGAYWEPGMQKLYYKIDEFKKISNDEALSYDMGEFDPYYDWKKDAAAAAKAQGYEVKMDNLSGQWIVTDVNGQLVQGSLYSFFKSMYGDDPRVQSNYDTEAYVRRKNFAKSEAQTFGSEDEAEKEYIMRQVNAGIKTLDKQYKNTSDAYDQVTSTLNELEKKKTRRGKLSEEDQKIYDLAVQQKESLSASKEGLQLRLNDIQANIDANDINSLRRRADMGVAAEREIQDMEGLAVALSGLKKERTIKANPFAEIRARGAMEIAAIRERAKLDHAKMMDEYKLKMNLEEYKHALKNGYIAKEDDRQYKVGLPGSNVQIDLDETPGALHERMKRIQHEQTLEAGQKTESFLFSLFAKAKNTYSADPAKSAGAKQFLDQFGDWNKIKDIEGFKKAMEAKKINSTSLLNSTLNMADKDKNPTGNYSWARPLIDGNAKMLDQIEQANDAAVAVLSNSLAANKKTVEIMMKNASKDPMLAYSDFFITPNGVENSFQSFAKKYIDSQRKYGNFNVDMDDAQDAYDHVKENFYKTFNANYDKFNLEKGLITSDVKDDLAILTGASMETKTIDSARKGKVATDIISTTSNALSDPGTIVSFGGATKDIYEDGGDAKLRNVLLALVNDSRKATAKDKSRPVFNATVHRFAAEKEGVSAITFEGFNPEYTKKYIGTKDSPGPLYGKDLTQPITLFFNNETVQSPIITGSNVTNMQRILSTKGEYQIKTYAGTAGKVHFEYDPLTDVVTGKWNYKAYDKGKIVEGEYNLGATDLSNVDQLYEAAISNLETQARKNQEAQQILDKL